MYADVRVSLSRGSMHAKVPNFAAAPRSIVTFPAGDGGWRY
jgi:hypothetical protein